MIIFYGSFAPIGCAPIVQEGFTGSGLRYLKKYAGACLQGAVIALIVVIGTLIKGAIYENVFSIYISFNTLLTATISALIVGIAEIVTIGKAQQLANDVMNV